LPEPPHDQATHPAEAAPAVRYAYKASLIGAAHQFELLEDGLSWRVAGKSGLWSYAGISAVRLSFRPISMQARRFRADIDRTGGGHIAIVSTSWQTAALMAPQDRDFRNFIAQLHVRMRAAGSRAELSGGLRPGIYSVAIGFLALVAFATASLFIRAIWTGEFSGALFLVGFAALFSWQIGGFVRRNRPRAYTFDDLPDALLP
jgi:hypothetical protein